MKKSFPVLVLAVILLTAGMVFWSSKPSRPSNEIPITSNAPPHKAAPAPAAAAEPLPEKAFPEWRSRLLLMDRKEALEWILKELASGADYATGSDLSIGIDQNLSAWPSYRVYLLDLLHLVDPDLAASMSKELVGNSQSPDEWALALRNVAKADAEGEDTDWLRAKTADLLRNKAWREDPSAGYLNAFDLIVHTRHTALSPELLTLCEDRDAKAVRHAAFLALDRLVQESPGELLPLLASTKQNYPGSGPMISNLMARADVRDDLQRKALEEYLLSESIPEEDLNAFAQVFPNANFHVSNNLLTKTEGIDGIELAERDRVAFEVVGDWLEDPRFSSRQAFLRLIQARLESFRGQ